MMEYTDRHFRKSVLLVSTKTFCYTEMVAANALIHEQLESKKKVALSMEEGINDSDDNGYHYDNAFRNHLEAQQDIQEYGYDICCYELHLPFPWSIFFIYTIINQKSQSYSVTTRWE